ncbi:hypothetical protein BDZ45DRAFT_669218, partial [Acephala macrosclerotiorum]
MPLLPTHILSHFIVLFSILKNTLACNTTNASEEREKRVECPNSVQRKEQEQLPHLQNLHIDLHNTHPLLIPQLPHRPLKRYRNL